MERITEINKDEHSIKYDKSKKPRQSHMISNIGLFGLNDADNKKKEDVEEEFNENKYNNVEFYQEKLGSIDDEDEYEAADAVDDLSSNDMFKDI
jgi:hypothetical protein